MNIVATLADGREFEIPCVKWHQPVHRSDGSFEPAGLWVLESHLIGRLTKLIKTQASRETFNCINGAEAHVSIYMDSEDHMPWKHYGLLVKTILPAPIMSLPHTFSFDGTC